MIDKQYSYWMDRVASQFPKSPNPLTEEDQARLAHIRKEVEKWIALEPDAGNWDSAFLLNIIDKLSRSKVLRGKE